MNDEKKFKPSPGKYFQEENKMARGGFRWGDGLFEVVIW